MDRLKAVFLLLLILAAAPCLAQNDIHRCIDASGRALFTDQTCAAMQATTVQPAPKPVANPNGAADAGTAFALSSPAEPPPILCAATFNQLRQSVIDAFANRNANRMAGLMLWNGYGTEAAVASIRALSTAMRQPLLDAGPPAASDTPATASDDPAALTNEDNGAAAAAAGTAIVVHLAGNDGSGNPRELRYGVVRRYGCLWLRVGG